MKNTQYSARALLQLFIALFTLIVLSGCASQSLEAQIADNVDLSEIKKIYVQKLEADGRGIEKIIADEFNRRGFEASSGPSFPAKEGYDALVTYQDKWMWDITMYMLELKIQIKDPETNFVMASGHSYRTSLVRESKEKMVEEVVGEILK